MRLRNIPGARDEISASRFCVNDPEAQRGSWRNYFQNDAPIHVEIGMGKGQFLMEMAARHPENNYIGIEMYSSVLLRAVQLADAREEAGVCPANFCFIRMDATEITEVFGEGEISKIYLNFSDPWPKARHAHRRLTSERFLARYEALLEKGGSVEFKTDNQELFAYSLEACADAGWKLIASTRDLHGDPLLCAGNVMTEYEQRYSGRGAKICKLIMQPKGI